MSNWISNSSESEVLGLQAAHINFEETTKSTYIYQEKTSQEAKANISAPKPNNESSH